jgi:hypothetical protein
MKSDSSFSGRKDSRQLGAFRPDPTSPHSLSHPIDPSLRANRLKRSGLEITGKDSNKTLISNEFRGSASTKTRNINQGGVRDWFNPRNRHTYRYVPGQFTQQEAWQVAQSQGGYPVVFNSMREFRRVTQAFDYRTIAGAHTGHYQRADGREPGLGWVTYTNEGSAPLNQLFNSDGPDDGIRNKWGWNSIDNEDGSSGVEIFYGPSEGKNEDAGVIWHDNEGRLEDVSVNARGGILMEFNG